MRWPCAAIDTVAGTRTGLTDRANFTFGGIAIPFACVVRSAKLDCARVLLGKLLRLWSAFPWAARFPCKKFGRLTKR
jgi:hypothetical protein